MILLNFGFIFAKFLQFLCAGCFGRNYGCNGRIKVSSTTLDSYGSLLSIAPLFVIIRAVLAMIQHERSASKTKIFGLRKFAKSENFRDFLEILIFSKNQKKNEEAQRFFSVGTKDFLFVGTMPGPNQF